MLSESRSNITIIHVLVLGVIIPRITRTVTQVHTFHIMFRYCSWYYNIHKIIYIYNVYVRSFETLCAMVFLPILLYFKQSLKIKNVLSKPWVYSIDQSQKKHMKI